MTYPFQPIEIADGYPLTNWIRMAWKVAGLQCDPRVLLINLMTSLLGCYVPSTHDLRHKPLVSFVEPNRGQPQQTRTWIVSKNTRTTSRDCATCCCRDFAHAIAGLRLIDFYFHSSFQIPRRNTFLIYVHLNVSTSPRCILSPSSISHGHVSCAPPLDSIQSYGH